MEWERNDKKEEWERNDLAEGPRSRTERNDFKKVGTCPTLVYSTWREIQVATLTEDFVICHCCFFTNWLELDFGNELAGAKFWLRTGWS